MDERISQAAIAARLGTQIIGRQLEVHEQIDSTNTRATELARQEAAEGTLVMAEQQTQGKGRLGRQWLAPPGSSLLMSLLLRPTLVLPQIHRVTMLCSLAIVEATARVAGLQACIKWPNDVTVEGKKVAGILTEASAHGKALTYVVVGMGINVNLDVRTLPDLLTPATSLATEAGHPISRLELLLAILEGIEVRYLRLQAGWSPREEWREHLATLGQAVRVGTREEVVEGWAEDVDEDGALLVRTDDGALRRMVAGDVTLRGQRVE